MNHGEDYLEPGFLSQPADGSSMLFDGEVQVDVPRPPANPQETDLLKLIGDVVSSKLGPLKEEMRKLQKENKKQTEKLTAIQSQLSVAQATLKEVQAAQVKVKQPLDSLLKAEGVEKVKKSVFDILHMRAGPEEDIIMEELVRELREGELLVKDSAKDLKNLSICFHEERNVLKQQVPKRVFKDLCNKSPESGSQLSTTIAYLTSHGLGALKTKELLRIYHLAYSYAMYLNQNRTLTSAQKVIRSNAEADIWKFVQVRMKSANLSQEEMKLKLKEALKNGFKPLD